MYDEVNEEHATVHVWLEDNFVELVLPVYNMDSDSEIELSSHPADCLPICQSILTSTNLIVGAWGVGGGCPTWGLVIKTWRHLYSISLLAFFAGVSPLN